MSHTTKLGESVNVPNGKIADYPVTTRTIRLRAQSTSIRTQPPRHIIQAGDLLSSTTHTSEAFGPHNRTYNITHTPRVSRGPGFLDHGKKTGQSKKAARLSTADDFDLREEVMSCIAKSIGLLQPPLSGSESVEASPALLPSESGSSGIFNTSFSSLSLFDAGDDGSSVTGSSSVSPDEYMSGLDNEVKILFFAAGSTLAKAGELNTGEFRIFRLNSLIDSPNDRALLCY
jgi:lysophospholipid hydrolase